MSSQLTEQEDLDENNEVIINETIKNKKQRSYQQFIE